MTGSIKGPTVTDDPLCARCGCYKSAHGEDERCEPVGWHFTAMEATRTATNRASEGDDVAYHVEQARTYISEPAAITSEKHMTSARWHLDKARAALSAKPDPEAVTLAKENAALRLIVQAYVDPETVRADLKSLVDAINDEPFDVSEVLAEYLARERAGGAP